MKSMQLLWQSSPVTNEEDEVLQEKESARQDCSIDPALAKEYVRALTEEQIPQPLLDKMADLINESIPELVRQSIDKEAEKRNIYIIICYLRLPIIYGLYMRRYKQKALHSGNKMKSG